LRPLYKKIVFCFFIALFAKSIAFSQTVPQDSIAVKKDTTKTRYNFNYLQSNGIFLKKPSTTTIEFDKALNMYTLVEKIGDYYVRTPVFMTQEEYKKYRLQRDMLGYFKSKMDAESGKKIGAKDGQKNLLPTYYINSKFFETIFGGNTVEFTPTGSLNLKLGFIYQNTENPQITEENRSSFTLDFDQQISASIRAKVGERLTVSADYDTQSTFDFQNLIKIQFIPPSLSDVKYSEDGIIQGIEAGNISMPIKNSLINGAQSLFGVKADLKFGNTNITAVFSQQNSESKVVTAEAGASIQQFELRATDYDTDRHFFLAQFFRNNYANSLKEYPLVSSQVNINRIEIWVTNRSASTEDFRSIVALADIGESVEDHMVDQNNTVLNSTITQAVVSGKNLPFNEANRIGTEVIRGGGIRDISTVESTLNTYMMQQGTDYSMLQNARKLQPNEYTLNSKLGFISLNRRLDDGEVLAVAYEYTVAGQVTGSDEKSFKVGEFSTDGIESPNNLAVKLLRSEILQTKRPNQITGDDEAFPTWRLMMKNIYALGAYPLTNDGFRFEVQYRDDETGIASNTLQSAKTTGISNIPLIQLLNVDQLDQSQFQNSDGFFDYVEGITVNSENGYVIFPEPEPFGENLENELTVQEDKDKFIFSELYLNTKINIKNNFQSKDKFLLKGYFKSENSGGIPLNAYNVPRGSVTVTVGGRQLVEGVDYVVDYQQGRVQIIDPGLEASGVPITVAVENNAVFNQQRKTFIGIDVEHKFSDDFIVGGTFLNVAERPLTPKVNYGAEPIDNTMLGFTVDYSTEVPFFTRLANKLPFVDTDVPSNLSVKADMAYLLPGTPSGIDVAGAAISYIDDFEASQVPISLLSPLQWFAASTPKFFPGFNGGNNDLSYNDKRAKLAWYNVDQIFYGFGDTPSNINADELSRAETRQISYSELFPNTELDITQNTLLRTLDLAFFPEERGPYNFDQNGSVKDGDEVRLTNPQTRWGGLMRPLTTNNFDQANVEYIQFWIMDPYENYSITSQEGLPQGVNPSDPSNQVGDLYINLGNISEDINKDNFKMYENGLPADGAKVPNSNVRESSLFGVVPYNPSIIYAFDIEDQARLNQDVGLDGLNNAEEAIEIDKKIAGNYFGSLQDPAADDFQYFRGRELDEVNASILRRYKKFNNTQGNSPTINQSTEPYPTSSTTYPDVEDINKDQTMNTVESYYEYKISMNKADFVKGRNFIVDEKITTISLENGSKQTTKWYQFRIPVRSGTPVNGISDFNSIRFMRMFVTNFKMPVVLRFGELDLVRGDYRRYTKTLDPAVDPSRDLFDDEIKNFEVGVISIEQNEGNYVLPPGIVREQLQGSTSIQRQNEQSVTLKVTNLAQNETRAIYKNISIDLRRSKNLKMFIHAQPMIIDAVNDDDFVAILRLGTDLDENFYQIEIPLKISPNGSVSPTDIWPEANSVDAVLEDFGLIKLARDALQDVTLTNKLYPALEENDSKSVIVRVKGNPTLAAIRTVMLGVKNTSPTAKSAEIWFNELRSSGFDNEGGWAMVLNADANFADLANVAVSGRMQTFGFGNVEDRVSQRSLHETKEYDISTSIDLAKVFTPQKWGIQLPMSYSIGEQFIDPKFDPQYQDVKLADALESNPNSEFSRDYTKRTSISFTNVKKNRNPNSTKKPSFYDVENVFVSYAHNKEFHRDYNIEKYVTESVAASAGYNFSFQSDFVEPFKNSKFLDGKYVKLIKDFNFNPIPKNIAVNSRINRNYNEQQSRNLVAELSDQPKLTQRKFLFDWDYSIGFDLTRSLQLNFNATNSYIYDSFESGEELQVFDNFFNTGRPNQYHQKLNATYKLPIEKIPGFNFISADVGYTADFDWQASSQDPDIVNKIGNVIQNANTKNGNVDFNFAKLYKNLGLEKLLISKKDKKKGKTGLLPIAPSRSQVKKKTSLGKKIAKGVYDLVTLVKTGKVSYAENNGQLLSGYQENFGFLGGKPTSFAFGSQVDIRTKALIQGWLVDARDPSSEYFDKTYSRTHYNKFDYNFTLEPFNDLDIDIRGNKIKTKDFTQQLDILEDGSENGRIDYGIGAYETGNFSTSYSMISTIFSDSDVLFQELRANRAILSDRLGVENGIDINDPANINSDGTVKGFGANSQQVLLPAFLAAYSGKKANTINTGLFRDIPIPNWTLRYTGLMKLDWFNENFSNFVVTHGYKSSYTISSFTNNLQYGDGGNNVNANSGNFEPRLLISSATLVDEFSPLIQVDMKMKNSFSLRGEIKKDRTLTLNFNNSTLTDIKGLEYIFGFGYVFKDIKFNSRFTGKKQSFKGDINLRADISLRDNLTTIRAIDTDNNQISGGQKLFSVKFIADYKLNSSLTASFYYNHQTSKYAISTTFPRQAINAGFNIIYNLGQ